MRHNRFNESPGTGRLTGFLCIFALVATAGVSARGQVYVLTPEADNTLYEDPAGGISNGSGAHLFAGRVGQPGNGRIRRALIRFPVDEAVPAGSVIQSATLTMRMTRTPAGVQTVLLRRMLADWGEGTSNAPLQEGNGTSAAANDATWRHRFFSGVFWGTMGGEFSGTTSGSAVVAGLGTYTWESTPQMVANVQDWLDSPATNFGWIVIGGEAATSTVKRFASREAKDPSERPTLTICVGACECGVADDCDDDTVCTYDACVGGVCSNEPVSYGDVNNDGVVDIFDILCVLDGFAGDFDACARVNLDLTPCPAGDDTIDVFDILAVLDGFAGGRGCCGP